MIPSRTTFHVAVEASTHLMQRRMVAVLATSAALLRRGASPMGGRAFGKELRRARALLPDRVAVMRVSANQL